MEEVIAIKVRDRSKGWVAFVTWGRLWGATNYDEILNAVRAHLPSFGVDADETLPCKSLREVRDAEYFYEALLAFAARYPQHGPEYEAWAETKRAALRSGRDIYFAGTINTPSET